MTAKTALVTVLAWGITFACVGAVIGATIGILAPEYYRSVFHHGDSLNFNPLQVGIGLGATQGIASGVAISIAVLALLAWRDVRAARPTTGTDGPNTRPLSRSWTIHAVWCVVTLMSVTLIGAVTFIAGGIVGQQQLYQSWTERKLDKLATILKSNEFNGIEADYSSAAQVYLCGTIKDSAARDLLHKQLVVTFGTEEADKRKKKRRFTEPPRSRAWARSKATAGNERTRSMKPAESWSVSGALGSISSDISLMLKPLLHIVK